MYMVSITLAVSEELKEKMEHFPEINWSAVARSAIERKIDLLGKMDRLLENSKLTEEDAIKLGRKVNKELAKRYKR